MGQLLEILSAAHERGIVHRDIKPENLFVERDGTLRILDFGVARVLEGKFLETRAGSVIGTLPYMAPEQMLGKSHEVDARSDVWSVGATAFTLVSGCFSARGRHPGRNDGVHRLAAGALARERRAASAERVRRGGGSSAAVRQEPTLAPARRAMQSAFAEAYVESSTEANASPQPAALDEAASTATYLRGLVHPLPRAAATCEDNT